MRIIIITSAINNMKQIKDMSLIELKELIVSGEKTSKEIYEYFAKRIEKYDETLNAFISKDLSAHADSHEALVWLPIAIKDIFSKKWRTTSGASKMLENFIPPYTSTVVKRLESAWMSYIGNTNMDEFAMWSTGENSAFGSTLNPWGTNRIPGGSSSGSAAAVAAWLVPAALWTDTGWSTRQPAFFTGTVWFKPTYWRNSRFGVHPMASSLDCPATFTKTVEDAGLLYDIMNGEDEKDATSMPWKDSINPKIWKTSSLEWKTIWVPQEYFDEWLDAEVKKAIKEAINHMEKLWATIKEISLPMTKYAVTSYYIICPAEVATNLARLDGLKYGYNSKSPHTNLADIYINNRGEGLGPEPQRRTIIWNYVLSAWFYDAYFKKAAQIRTLIIKDFDTAFEWVDAIVWPCAPTAAWKLWEKTDDPLKMYLADAYTIPASLAGLPGISVPCGFVEDDGDKLPVWIQILAPRGKDQELLEIANVYEKSAWWREQMIPEGFED